MRVLLLLMLSVIGIAGHPADAFAQEAPVPVPAPVPATAAHVAHQQAVESATAAVDQLDDSALQIPVAKLDFKPQQAAIPGANGSMAFSSPIVCSPSGIPFVTFIEPSDFGPQTIYSLDPKGGHAFSVKEVPGLYDTNFIHGYFVSDSVVGILVNGTKDSKVAPNTVSIGPKLPPRHIYTGEHHDYLVEFDISGNYKTTLELPERYQFRRLAALQDDTLLALAYDPANLVPMLFLLDSGGNIIRTLQIPAEMVTSPEIVTGQSGDIGKQIRAAGSLSWWIFAPTRNRVLLYQAHSKSPVLEVGAGGAVREVPLHSPKGYVLESVLSANDRWIMRFRKESLSDAGAIDARPEANNYVLYEVDSSDGSLRRRIEVEGGLLSSLACEQDGVFTAFSVDGEKVTLATADLPR
jgi:hypothetical protein